MSSDDVFQAARDSRARALSRLATFVLLAGAALELLNALELFIAWLTQLQRPLGPGGHLPGKLRLGTYACAALSLFSWVHQRHELWRSGRGTNLESEGFVGAILRFPLRLATAPVWLGRSRGASRGSATTSIPLLLLGLCWVGLLAGWGVFAYFDLARPFAEASARRTEFWLTGLGLATYLLTALATNLVQRHADEARVFEAMQAHFEAVAAPFPQDDRTHQRPAPQPIEIDPSWREEPAAPLEPKEVPAPDVDHAVALDIEIEDAPALELDSSLLVDRVFAPQPLDTPPAMASAAKCVALETVTARAVTPLPVAPLKQAVRPANGAALPAVRLPVSPPSRVVAAHRVGGALMLLAGAASLALASQGTLDRSYGFGLSTGSAIDVVLGALLLAGAKKALTLSRIKAVLGIAGVLVTAAVTKDLFQTTAAGLAVATLLALLVGEPDRMRSGIGAAGAACSVALTGFGLFAAFTGDALLARPVLWMRGMIGAAAQAEFKGKAVDFGFELTPGRWFALSEAPIRQEIEPEQWLVLPRYGAHLAVYVHHVPGAGGIDLTAIEEQMSAQRRQAPGFKLLGGERIEGPFDEARWARFEEGTGAQKIESFMAMFAQGDFAFVLAGSAPQRNYSRVEADFRRAMDSFRYAPVPKPSLAESALAQVRAGTALVLTESGSGSAFVLGTSRDGLVLATNAHVARPGGNGEKVHLIFGAGSKPLPLRAKVLASDPDRDLALLTVDAPEIRAKALPLRKSAELPAGTAAFVAGFPLGLSLAGYGAYPSVTFSAGRIARRPTPAISATDKLVIDAGINPGNSGGPVVDAEGAVIGVATAHVRASETSFVVPSEKLAEFVAERAPGVGLLWNDWELPSPLVPPAGIDEEGREHATEATALVHVGKRIGAGALVRVAGRLLVLTSHDLTHDDRGRARAGTRISAGLAPESPTSAAEVLLTAPSVGLTILDGRGLEGHAALELGTARALPETSVLQAFGFRVRDGAPVLRQVRTALLLARQFDRGRTISRLQFDIGTSRGFSGGPVVDSQGKMAAFALPVEAGENLAEALPAEVIVELLRGSVRGGTARYVADGMDHCYLELYVELDDPLGAVEAISVAFQAPADEAWLAGNPAAFPIGAPVARIERSAMNVLKLRPDRCPTLFGFQIFLEDAKGRRADEPRSLVLPPTGNSPESFTFVESLQAGKRLDDWAFLQTPFLPPSDWTPGCPADSLDSCRRRCSQLGGASCFALARRLPPTHQDARAAMRRACESGVAVACTAHAEMLGVDAEVETWQRRGCEAGDGRACKELGNARLGYDPPLALDFLLRGCSQRDGESCLAAGQLRLQGTAGAPDAQSARELFTQGCQLWSEEACFSLAGLVLEGRGLPPDPVTAYDLFLRACSGAHAGSCIQAAEMNLVGRGTPRSPLLAYLLLDRGCQLGAPQACSKRVILERAHR